MRAIRYFGPNEPFRLTEIPRPVPGAGEVLVRITATAMCHTELHFRSGILNLGVAPVTMGHEIVGRVEEVGQGVGTDRIGERVIVYYYAGCGSCAYCVVGNEQLCPRLRAEYGFISDGGYADYIAVPSRNAVVLPGTLDDVHAAPIGCGITTAVHASHLAEIAAGEWTVVYGIGGVGLGAVQVARARGARVIAVSRTMEKLRKAEELGAECIVNASKESVVERIKDITAGRGADVVLECVGIAGSMSAASGSLGRRGRLVFIGYSEDTFSVHPIQLVVFEQKVLGSVGATLGDLQEALDLVKRGVVHTVVDRTLALDRYESGLEALQNGHLIGKAVLLPET